MRRAFRSLATRAALAASLALVLAAPAGHAFPRPTLHTALGGTTAILGDPNGGGLSIGAAALWPVEERLSFGVCGFADDLGGDIVDLRDSTGARIGRAADKHRAAYGAAWRMDARIADHGRWQSYASGTWGFYRLRDDRLGSTEREWSSTGFSLAAGARHPIRGVSTLGVVVRYHRLFNDLAGRYVSASLEWGWR